jgi:hypothetical protein
MRKTAGHRLIDVLSGFLWCYAAQLGYSEMMRTSKTILPRRTALTAITIGTAAGVLAFMAVAQQQGSEPVGFTDTPMLPDQPWHVHDINRPHPRVVTPGERCGDPPSDAVVLFDGKDLSHWVQRGRGADRGKLTEPKWKVENGYFEIAPRTGDLISKEKFGDAQYHVEWAAPAEVRGNSQARGNSGFIMMSRYELQILDSYNNVTYADGQAGAIYGQWPPLVNPSRKPGEWQTYDIIFEAPKFDGDRLVKPAYETVFYNGVVVQNHQQVIGAVVYRQVAKYTPHGPEEPLMLQDHGYPVRFRNIWVRRLTPRDQPEARS